MRPFDAMEQQRVVFLDELYKRAEGDPRQGVPYEELIEALGFDESVTKRIQAALQHEGLVELTAVPPMTNVGRPVMNGTHRGSRRQTIAMTSHGVRVMEEILSDSAPG
jgi:hypothetical protein